MAALYFHIPFCKRLCGYCDFMRSVKLRYMPQVVEQMGLELATQSALLSGKPIKTIYFGGGTPSLLEPSVVERLISQAHRFFDCSAVEEITIEVNPDDVTEEYATQLAKTSVNRVSLGVQSADDQCLQFMGRRHTAQQAVDAVRWLQQAGFGNISVDLIFGVDGFDARSLERSLHTIIGLDVQHISAYHLTIEPSTRFGRLLSKGELAQVGEEQSQQQFDMVHRYLTDAGFEHYEVSNFAKTGYRSKHNSSYWLGVEYLGIGPGAHSYIGNRRHWCTQSVEEYINGVEYGSEVLSTTDMLNEYVMVSLRRIEGIDLDFVAQHWSTKEQERLMRAVKPFEAAGWVVCNNKKIAIPPKHFLTSDMVIAELFK